MFGFGSVPLTSYFNKTAGSSANTMFSPAARVMLQQEEEMQRQQEAEMRRQQAEQIANQILGQAPGMTEEQMNQELLRNPQVFGGGLEGLSNYRQFRQQVAPSQSDEVLGPAFLKKIADPRHASRFQQRMLQEGMSANDAWEAYRADEHNDKYAVALAEADVPREEYQSLQVNGMFDPVAVASRITKAKKEGGTGRGSQEIDRHLSRMEKLIELKKDQVEEGDTGFEKDKKGQYKYPELVNLRNQYEQMVGLSMLSPEERASALKAQQEAAAAPPPAAASTTPVVEEKVTEEVLMPEQRASRQAAKSRDEEIKQKIGSAWTQAKNTVERNILRGYAPEDLDVVAQAIVENKGAPIEAGAQLVDTGAGAVPERYKEFVLRKLGLSPFDVAFSEPENERWGTQDVTNQELLEVWAKERLKGKKASSTVAADPGVTKLLEKYLPKK
jgi:hypothetical protein